MKSFFMALAAASDRVLHIVLRPKYLLPAILCLFFLISAIFLFIKPARTAVSLWYPDSRINSKALNAELRFIPRNKDQAMFAETLLEELILGPANSASRAFVPSSTRVSRVIASNKDLYIDISPDFLFGSHNDMDVYSLPDYEPSRAIDLIKKNLSWNLKKFNIILTVSGLEPW